MSTVERYYRELAQGKRRGVADRLLIAALTLPALCYGALLRLRAMAYTAGVFSSRRLPRPVVSVGNLSVGGTGKTPMVALLARRLMARGKRVVVLSRGYGGSLRGKTAVVADGNHVFLSPVEAGDEPVLLAMSVPGLMVVVGSDRYQAGLLAMERLAPDVFILDDGFQHLRLERDLNILLLDGSRPFGNGLTFPAGLLREPAGAVHRADLVVYTRCEGAPPQGVTEKPSCGSTHQLTGAIPLSGGEELSFSGLRHLRAVAFAGIAEPAGFFHSLQREGVQLAATLPFPDHCPYGEQNLAAIVRLKKTSGADYLITTGKDGVKLAPHLDRLGPTYTAGLELRLERPALLEEALDRLIATREVPHGPVP